MSNKNNAIKVRMPNEGQQTQVHIKPGEHVQFENVDFDAVEIDILGPDVIITNPDTNAKILLPGLGLILFSQEEAPVLFIEGGVELSPQALLSKVGIIQNVTQEDFLTFTSLNLDPEQGVLDRNFSGLPEHSKSEEQQEQIETATEEYFNIASYMEEFTTNFTGENSASLRKSLENDETTPEDETIEAIQNSRAEFIKDATGALLSPPTPPSSPTAPQTTDTSPDVAPPVALAGTSLSFEASLLQTSLVDDLAATQTVFGGGAAQTAAFDASNAAQFSTETIDTTIEPGAHTIYLDDPTDFSSSAMTRVLKVEPTLPNGFDITEITVSGLPAGYDIVGATRVGGPTSDYVFTPPTLDGNGDFVVEINYPVPSSQLFTLNIAATAEFDVLSGLQTPDQTTQTYTIIQEVETKDVNTPADGNYASADPNAGVTADDNMGNLTFNGNDVWVMANNANGNRVFTGDGDVTVFGGEGDDQVSSGDGDDDIRGEGGDDIIVSGDGDDIVRGGLGSDRMSGGTGTDTVDFSDMTSDIVLDISTFVGGFSQATIGADTDEVLGFENITGGTGNDTLTGDANDNVIDGGEGDNILDGGLGNDTITAGAGDDTLTGGDGNDILTGGDGTNTFIGGLGNDTITGGSGIDTLDYSYSASGINIDLFDQAINPLGGDIDTISGIENVIGTNGIDIMLGSNGANTFDSGLGDDIIIGGLGDDTVLAGDNNDTIWAGGWNGTSFVTVATDGQDTYDGGNGTDLLNLSILTSGVTVVIDDASGFANMVSGGGETDQIRNIEQITATSQADNITGDTSDETFRGEAGNDILNGGAGNDTIYGGLGDDTLDGGTGTNTVRFDDLGGAQSITNLDLAGGTVDFLNGDQDTIQNFTTYILNNLANDTITAHNNAVVETINGMGGAADFIDYSGATGLNLTVNLLVTTNTVLGWGAADNLLNIENITTSTGDDQVYGSNSANTIITGAGDDIVRGYAGNDILDGGTNTATGDILDYSYTSSSVTWDMTNVNVNGFLITIGAEQDRAQNFEEFHGSLGNDTFTGDASANIFDGNSGNDLVNASLGNDQYDGDTGNDSIYYDVGATFNSHGLTVDLSIVDGNGFSTVTFAGTGDTHLIKNFYTIYGTNDTTNGDDIRGTAIDEIFRGRGGDDTLRGFGGNDILDGDSGNDTLYGGDGNDTLQGEGGVDQLFGEDGDDILFANGADGDTFNGGSTGEASGDTVSYLNVGGVGVTVALDVNGDDTDSLGNTLVDIENIVGTNNVDNITGNASANTLSGNSGADIINGGGGNDVLNGNQDNDTIYGDTGNDTIQGGTGDDHLYGEAGIDNVIGNDGDDTLYADTAGGDTLNGSTTAETNGDTVNYSSIGHAITLDLDNTGADTDSDGNVLISIENITGANFAGAGDNITGNDSANIIQGLDGDDTLNGEAGQDEIRGGDGNDIINGGNDNDDLYGDDGNDTIDGGGGVDTMRGGAGNDTFIASGGNDTLIGNSGDDIADYSAHGGTITRNSGTGTISKTASSSTDTLFGVEQIWGTAGNDRFELDVAELSDFTLIDGNGGSDTLELSSELGIGQEGTALDAIFDDIEVIDFRNASLNGADPDFVLTGADVFGLTGNASGTLRIQDDGDMTFDLLQNAGGYTANGLQSSVGSIDTYTFTNGGNTATIEVETV